MAQNMMPYGNLVKSTTSFDDPWKRDNTSEFGIWRTLTDNWKMNTPGLSKEIGPMLDPLGTPIAVQDNWEGPTWYKWLDVPESVNKMINPWKASKHIDDPIFAEVNRQWKPYQHLESGFPLKAPSPTISVSGISIPLQKFKWTTPEGYEQNMYTRYAQLAGTIENGNGENMREFITAEIQKQGYKDLPDFDPELSRKAKSKMDMITSWVGQYRRLAMGQLAVEALSSDDPEMRNIGIYMSLYLDSIIEHLDGNPDKVKLIKDAMEDLLGHEEGAVESAILLQESGLFNQ